MYITTANQSKAADQHTIHGMGVPSLVLMETAANRLLDACPDVRSALIFCGGGNNGGDGFCLGRLLAQKDTAVRLVCLCPPEKMTPDALAEYHLAMRFGIPVLSLEEAATITDAELVIDAMLGTGQTGAPKEPIASAVAIYNQMQGIKLAVDLPAGVNCDTGEVYDPVAQADITVCLGSLKYGVLIGEGQIAAGQVVLKEIGIPREAFEIAGASGTLVDAAWATAHMPQRSYASHKYTCGSILIFSGSAGMTGAPVLAAQGALYSGAGLITAAVPSCVADIVASKLTEPLILPLPSDWETFEAEAGRIAVSRLEKMQAAVVGPGIKNTEAAIEAMQTLIRDAACPLVIDAGALPCVFHRPVALRSCTVITPHHGEAARLLSCTAREIAANPVGSAQALAEQTGCICVLKGHPTITATPDRKIYVGTTGNPGMATGGTGDVLAGVIASLIGQGVPPSDAAALGVYLHGCAGDLAEKEKGQWGLCASDVAQKLPEAILITQKRNVSL